MEQWRNLIHINRNFQKAVNLQLDIGDHGRIEHYIPTRSSMLILRRYLKKNFIRKFHWKYQKRMIQMPVFLWKRKK